MLKAKDIMTRDVKTVTPDTPALEAASILLGNHLNGLPVLDREGRVLGIICQSDLVFQQEKIPLPSFFSILGGWVPLRSSEQIENEIKKMAALTVADAMTADPVTVGPDTHVDEIATIMVRMNVHTLPVIEEGRLAGIIGKEDILKTLLKPENQ
ncbi:MAG: CBS domain-containing protein [Syntrophales bacterium]|nr:CBS domain-containing protein [Syntrophales bacterium]MDD5232799.1 CBS domain-containing protein [Syntrophales bacterium]